MHRKSLFLGSLFLTATLLAPMAMRANAAAQAVRIRIYDRNHRDYHNWDDHEDHAYRRYLAAQHKTYREYHKQHYSVKRHYWNWRHSHPDRD